MLLNLEPVGLVVTAAIFIWLVGLSWLVYRNLTHYRRLTAGVTKKDLKTVLEKLLKGAEKEEGRVDKLIEQLEKVEKDGVFHIQKIGLVRFNPFADTGGDQSFTLALLNGEDSGFVISSLHSRESTRFYAKPVKKGKALGYELSAEEKRAIKRAKKIK